MLDDILKDTQAYKELTQRGFMAGELKGKNEGELLGVRTSIPDPEEIQHVLEQLP